MTRAMLDGLRIVTVSQFGAGPFGTQLLADLGAEVIKIEDPAVGGDVSRQVGPYAADGDSLYFQSFNRGKKSLTLDLKHPDGQAVLHDLVRVGHAVYNNLRGDLPAKLGLTYAALGRVNPAIVCCSLSGFGATGPRAAEPAFDYLIQGYAGWMSVTGEPDGPPGKCGVSVVDFAGGYASMAALLAGLWDAQRTGVGRDIDVSLLDTAVSMLSYFAIWALNRDWQADRVADSGHQSLVPAQNFPTRDGWIVVFCNKEKFWQALLDAHGAARDRPRSTLRHLRGPARPQGGAGADPQGPLRRADDRRVAGAAARARAVRAGQHAGPGAGGRASASPGHDPGGRAPDPRPPARGRLADPHDRRGRPRRRPASGRAHRSHPARCARL